MNRNNDDKLDRLADAIEAAQAIANDDKWTQNVLAKNYAPAFLHVIRNHKPEVVKILAFIDNADAATYEIDSESIFRRLMKLYRDDDIKVLLDLFTSRVQKNVSAFSGPVTENTEGGAK